MSSLLKLGFSISSCISIVSNAPSIGITASFVSSKRAAMPSVGFKNSASSRMLGVSGNAAGVSSAVEGIGNVGTYSGGVGFLDSSLISSLN